MTDEELAKRVRAATRAGWWTVLVFAVWLTLGWGIWLAIMHARPGWVLALWGGATWAEVMTVSLISFAAIKGALLLAVGACIWLSLWARRLSPGR